MGKDRGIFKFGVGKYRDTRLFNRQPTGGRIKIKLQQELAVDPIPSCFSCVSTPRRSAIKALSKRYRSAIDALTDSKMWLFFVFYRSFSNK